MVGKIFIHPGIGKTGTSAIQRYAEANFTLESHGGDIVYCPIGKIDGAHNAFSDVHPQFDQNEYEKCMADLCNLADGVKQDILISSEFLIRSSVKHIRQFLSQLGQTGRRIKLIFSIRNYDDYLISSYLQAVKVNWGMKRGESIFEYSVREVANIRLPMLVDQWSRFVGDESVTIFDYDKCKANLLQAFFREMGVEIGEYSGLQVNKSIKMVHAPLVMQFDLLCSDLKSRQEFVDSLSTYKFNNSYEKAIREDLSKITLGFYSHDLSRLIARYHYA